MEPSLHGDRSRYATFDYRMNWWPTLFGLIFFFPPFGVDYMFRSIFEVTSDPGKEAKCVNRA